MKFIYCLLLLLAVGTLGQTQQYYLRRSDAQKMLSVIGTHPELFDEVFAAKDIVGNDNMMISFLPPGGMKRESQSDFINHIHNKKHA